MIIGAYLSVLAQMDSCRYQTQAKDAVVAEGRMSSPSEKGNLENALSFKWPEQVVELSSSCATGEGRSAALGLARLDIRDPLTE